MIGAKVVMLGAGQHARILAHDAKALGLDVVTHATEADNLADIIKDTGAQYFINGVGGVADNHNRAKAWGEAVKVLFPLSYVFGLFVSYTPFLGNSGLTAMPSAHIGDGVKIGDNVLVNTGAIIEHDCAISDHVHIAPGAILCGNVTVGEGAHIGAGAVVRQGIRIGAWAIVGCGAVVIKDVPDGVTVVGNPARPIRRQDGICL